MSRIGIKIADIYGDFLLMDNITSDSFLNKVSLLHPSYPETNLKRKTAYFFVILKEPSPSKTY